MTEVKKLTKIQNNKMLMYFNTELVSKYLLFIRKLYTLLQWNDSLAMRKLDFITVKNNKVTRDVPTLMVVT